jgi:hypothetical protein
MRAARIWIQILKRHRTGLLSKFRTQVQQYLKPFGGKAVARSPLVRDAARRKVTACR